MNIITDIIIGIDSMLFGQDRLAVFSGIV